MSRGIHLSLFVSFTLFTFLAPRPAITSLHHSFAALSLSVLFPSFISSPAVMSKGQGVSSPTSCCQCSCLLLRYLLALAFSYCPNEQAAQHWSSWCSQKHTSRSREDDLRHSSPKPKETVSSPIHKTDFIPVWERRVTKGLFWNMSSTVAKSHSDTTKQLSIGTG